MGSIMEFLDKLYNTEPVSPRLQKQIEIEDQIVAFGPVALEVHDMLEAFSKALTDRYSEEATEVNLYFTLTQKALERLDGGLAVDPKEAAEALDALKSRKP